jgi:hypothetical protein
MTAGARLQRVRHRLQHGRSIVRACRYAYRICSAMEVERHLGEALGSRAYG